MDRREMKTRITEWGDQEYDVSGILSELSRIEREEAQQVSRLYQETLMASRQRRWEDVVSACEAILRISPNEGEVRLMLNTAVQAQERARRRHDLLQLVKPFGPGSIGMFCVCLLAASIVILFWMTAKNNGHLSNMEVLKGFLGGSILGFCWYIIANMARYSMLRPSQVGALFGFVTVFVIGLFFLGFSVLFGFWFWIIAAACVFISLIIACNI